MSYFDPMDTSTPTNSSPSTPKPGSDDSDTPPPLYKSNATVTSLSPEPNEHINTYSNEYQQNYTATYSPSPDLFSDFDFDDQSLQSQSRFSTPTPRNNISISRPRTYAAHTSPEANSMYDSQTSGYMFLSPPPINPHLTILLVLTPNPASLADLTALETFAPRFCKDFSSESEHPKTEWRCVNLYAHFREWAAMQGSGLQVSNTRGMDDDRNCHGGINKQQENVDIGSIHPYALRAKLQQEKEVQWRLALPVLRTLIDREVKKGARELVVCGLRTEDIEGVRAFGRLIARPAGIIAFLPPPSPCVADYADDGDDDNGAQFPGTLAVPSEYHSRTVTVPSTPPLPQIYNTLLAQLYARIKQEAVYGSSESE